MKGILKPSPELSILLELLDEFSNAWEKITLLLANPASPGTETSRTKTYREALAKELDLIEKLREFSDALDTERVQGDPHVLRCHCFLVDGLVKEAERLNSLHIGLLEGKLGMDLNSADRP